MDLETSPCGDKRCYLWRAQINSMPQEREGRGGAGQKKHRQGNDRDPSGCYHVDAGCPTDHLTTYVIWRESVSTQWAFVCLLKPSLRKRLVMAVSIPNEAPCSIERFKDELMNLFNRCPQFNLLQTKEFYVSIGVYCLSENVLKHPPIDFRRVY